MVSLVLQDVHLFSGTIADNIRLGNDALDDEDVRRAAQAVHADAFIAQLPDGYATAVAERGSTLSVGQKQLLSFARALAFEPRVLILDEATSSVDTDTELLIRDALHVLMAGRTTIAIAHRLSTIQDMDRILVLHKGHLQGVGHPPGAAGAARDLLPAVRAAGTGTWSSRQSRSASSRRPSGLHFPGRPEGLHYFVRTGSCGKRPREQRRTRSVFRAAEKPVEQARRGRDAGSSPGGAPSGGRPCGRTPAPRCSSTYKGPRAGPGRSGRCRARCRSRCNAGPNPAARPSRPAGPPGRRRRRRTAPACPQLVVMPLQ